MENKKIVPAWIGIFNLILVVACLAWTGYSMFTAVPDDGNVFASEIIHGLTLALLVVALLHCLIRGTKVEKHFFNGFAFLYLIYTFITTLLVLEAPIFLPIISIIAFGNLCILAVANEISKAKAYALLIVNILIAIARIVLYYLASAQIPGAMVGNLLLALILGIMVYAKYKSAAVQKAE